jgi:hypothetical protein
MSMANIDVAVLADVAADKVATSGSRPVGSTVVAGGDAGSRTVGDDWEPPWGRFPDRKKRKVHKNGSAGGGDCDQRDGGDRPDADTPPDVPPGDDPVPPVVTAAGFIVKPSHMVKFLKDTEYKTWEIRKQAPSALVNLNGEGVCYSSAQHIVLISGCV